MRDASGQIYTRNRYYDPTSGQFTQPDPIGLAGGLNSYGFAAGDPVGFWDPFGLCAWGYGPDAARGTCSTTDAAHAPPEASSRPLSPDQRERVNAAIGNLETGLARRLSRMLARGQIRAVERARFGRAAGADIPTGRWGTRYEIDLQDSDQEEPAFFTYRAEDGSWILAHEYGHIVQWQSGRLVELRGPRIDARGAMFLPIDAPNFQLLQQDANLFACRRLLRPSPTFGGYCANNGISPP
jgi:uncharacterized protein RhaS with RHS repeats